MEAAANAGTLEFPWMKSEARRACEGLKHRLKKEEDDREKHEELERALATLDGIKQELRTFGSESSSLTLFERRDKISQLGVYRSELLEMHEIAFRLPEVADYTLEVMIDLEGVAHFLSRPALISAPVLEAFVTSRTEVLVSSLGDLFYLALGGVILYVLFASTPSWVGWITAMFFAWLYYGRSKRFDRWSREVTQRLQDLRIINLCVGEVSSRCFDGSEVARRLRQLEPSGLYVPTKILTMLQFRATMPGT